MTDSLKRYALIPLRLMFGFGFIYHGFPKLFSSAGHERILGMVQSIGVPLPELMAWVVGIVEFFGGIALLIGAFVPLAAALLSINMLVAALTVHLPHGFHFVNITGMTEAGPQFGMPGMETPLLYLAGLLTLMMAGAGPISVDWARGTGPIMSSEGEALSEHEETKTPTGV